MSREQEGSGQEVRRGWGSGEGLSPKGDRRYRAPEDPSGRWGMNLENRAMKVKGWAGPCGGVMSPNSQ